MGSSSSQPEFNCNSTGDQVAAKWGATHAKDRYFLVTGAGAGLGFETACVLAGAGAKVTVTARTQEAADKVVADIKAKVLSQYSIDDIPVNHSCC